jgi:NTE family protein
MKALCISGGGSMGAWAGGVVEFLKSDKDWDIFFGTSTGSLIIPLVAADKIDKLKIAYTSIKPDDIFTLNPFKIESNKNGEFRFKLNHWNIINNFIKNGTKTLGDSNNLRKTISKFLSEEEYEFIKNNKSVNVSVCNLTTGELEMKSSDIENYSDFIDWVQASASATPFMSFVEKNGFEYADGGIRRYIPIIEAIESGATEIDAIVLMENEEKIRIEKVRNVLHLIGKLINIFLNSRKKEDTDLLKLSKSIKKNKELIINFYYLPRKITNNPYIFDSETMMNWWLEGHKTAQNGPDHIYKLKKNKVKKIK